MSKRKKPTQLEFAMKGHAMKLYPFDEVASALLRRRIEGFTFFQQFNCAACGAKQTMETRNKLFTEGKCEECQHITDIVRDGCNYVLISAPGVQMDDILKTLMRKP